ncbi:NUDIX hydrolase [Actinomyces sp. 2119]|uniref:NUDIX hydrolase n=1 Tax=Actinomyces lilanjuaniae TaxID=2321394 RepID=A0ABM6Z1N8_9ACTO|nr:MULTISPECIES: NUDIX hydrolase [Actinomyces]AYD89190.1 NUDIX hydrolase [Actinomyces lilanjuaniae]RJF41938.1 NUDIX hydrolase [Actinomyces sp. 2119]
MSSERTSEKKTGKTAGGKTAKKGGGKTGKGGKAAVRAAGALVWRDRRGRLEVLVVHRPRYDDWSFPKGKVEPGESVRTCAVREVAEETGRHVVLGQPLTTVRYRLGDGTRKQVSYWAARLLPADSAPLRARPAVEPASRREIDDVEWMSAKKARKRLTHVRDRDLLGELVDLWEDGKLDTWTLVLVRHARAVKRSVWNRPRKRDKETDEATRPLTRDQGEGRAQALVPILSAYGVARVVTSPWRRCADTVAPYARAAGLEAEQVGSLTEAAHAQQPKEVRAVVARELRHPEAPVALCTHRPVLPTVMDVVAQAAPGRLLRSVPDRDPWLKTGEILVVHLARRPRGKVRAVAIEKQRPVLAEGR